MAYEQTSFKQEQLKNSRVRTAYAEKWAAIKKVLRQQEVDTSAFEVAICCFKKENQLEVWIKSKQSNEFNFKITYAICAQSGGPGPKRMQGDGQVPEGFYHVRVFNPYSNFYLSLGINYPNASDKILGKGKNLGGDIMIHGNCVTIGCIPLTDDKIKEVYVLAVEAHNSGQKEIPVFIFPNRMDSDGMKWLAAQTKDGQQIAFWNNLHSGYEFFEKNRRLPVVSVEKNGKYDIR